MHKTFLCFLLFFFAGLQVQAQQLAGIWSGKISRKGSGYSGVENIEIQIYQEGKQLRGYTFAFKDTSRFVLFNMAGNRSRRTQSIYIRELKYLYYLMPPNFWPCEKIFNLKYYKIGKTQYLSGTWTGQGIDTSCFPGEELLVVLQKIKKPEYPIESFVQKKITDQILWRNTQPDVVPDPEPEITESVTVSTHDIAPADRKLDIQEIINLADTTVKITLYDNAIVDDDTVSVFLNKKPVLLRQRISTKPLSFNIVLTEPGKPFEVIMQAENLGSIPPNTAVMIIETAHKRYEVRLSAGFEKHAVVIITYNPD
ncbi:hypothetical protein [Ferruginibacter sp.]|nr:hypothetical protein [Ferruginibacter sp.]